MLFLPISSFFLRAQQGTAYTVFSYGIQTLLIVWGFAALLFFSRESIKQQQQTQVDQRIICQNLILDQIIMEERKPHPPVAKYGIVVIDNKITKADRCLCSQLGPRIDVKWNIDTAQMELCKSQSQHFVHEKDQKEEVFRCVPFFHDKICELEDQNILKNPDFPVVPCAVVLIKDKQNRRILATKRHERMSFGNLWVLPGGHLENGETIIQGGLRQCFQEVGLKPESYSIDKNPQVMAWQSVLMNPTNTKIKRVALIIFFSVECEPFEVNEQKSEVKAWQWRQFQNGERPWGGDWAQGHLRYLDYLSKQEQNPKM